jgi:hypothetical protein
MASDNPKQVTIAGRLSFPSWTAKEAYDLSLKGSYPAKDAADASPHFQMLVSDAQWQKFYKHATEVFLPYCAEQFAKGEKRDSLSTAEVKALADGLLDLANQQFNTPAKPVHEKTQALAPEAVATIKAIGQKGGDLDQKAIVYKESELLVPDPDRLTWPGIYPIGQTIHAMYPGCYVTSTLSLYAYHNGRHPGFSAGASTAVFKMDGERFGGSVAVDEDEMFLD